MRRPTEEELWLLLGYTAWFCLIYGLWMIVTHLPAQKPG